MKKKFALFFIVAAILAGAGFWFWHGSRDLLSDKAIVEGQLARAAVGVPGTVSEVYVAAGEIVAQGQPLFALDKSGYEMQLAKERARLAEIAATLPGNVLVPSPTAAHMTPPGKPLAALRVEEEDARKAVAVAAHVYSAASVNVTRMGSGARGDYGANDPKRQAAIIARDEAALALQKAKDAYEKASYARARREADEKASSGGMMSAALAARVAEYQAHVSRVRLAEQSLAATVVLAPENGRVLMQAAAPGVSLQAGDAPVVIVPEKGPGVWVTAFFSGKDGGAFAAGQECFVLLPGTSEVRLAGRIGAVLPAPDAEKGVAVRVILDNNTEALLPIIGKAVTVAVPVRAGFALPAKLAGGTAKN